MLGGLLAGGSLLFLVLLVFILFVVGWLCWDGWVVLYGAYFRVALDAERFLFVCGGLLFICGCLFFI
jgi:hypothetical protein